MVCWFILFILSCLLKVKVRIWDINYWIHLLNCYCFAIFFVAAAVFTSYGYQPSYGKTLIIAHGGDVVLGRS